MTNGFYNGVRLLSVTRRVLVIASIVVLFSALPSAFARDVADPPEPELTGLQHTTFLPKDGAPSDVRAMAQTADGFLWIATPSGLFRFDGDHFDTSLSDGLPSPSVVALLPESNGDLWIGYAFGGVSRLHAGRITHFSTGSIPGTVKQFARAPDGRLWLATSSGLATLEGSTWVAVGTTTNYSGESPDWIGGTAGDLVVSTQTATYQLSSGATKFERRPRSAGQKVRLGIPAVSQWLPDLQDTAQEEPNQTMVDRGGQLWISGHGSISRYRGAGRGGRDPAVSRFTKADGLTGEAGAFLQDKEGNIWVGTEKGLDRFSQPKIQRLAIPGSAFHPLLIAGDNGEVWLGRARGRVFRVSSSGGSDIEAFGTSVIASARAPDGSIWLAGRDGLFHSVQGQVTKVPLPVSPAVAPDVTSQTPSLQAVAVDGEGALWLSIARVGLFRWKNSVWDSPGRELGLPAGPAIRLRADDDGRLWLAYPDNTLGILVKGKLTLLTHRDGISVGNVLAIDVRKDRAWIGGDEGVGVYEHNRFRALLGRSRTTFRIASGIVETRAGELWLNTGKGVYRIRNNSVADFLAGAQRAVDFELFDSLDGLDSAVEVIRPGPTLMEAADGRLWIARYEGVWWIDPNHIRRNHVAPIVTVEDIACGTTVYPADAAISLPKGTRSLRIDYTAPEFTEPERLSFRYRLEHVDEEWQDAGQRRQAYYTNLAPGHYRFLIMAANADGVWSTQTTILRFDVAPAFYQRLWFRVLCATILLLLTTVVFFICLGKIQGRYRQRVRERHAERDRIARELHDTLLQGIQALLFRLHNWETDPNIPAAYREEVAAVVQQARAIVVEGRDRILQLRRSESQPADLVAALQIRGGKCIPGRTPELGISIVGEPRPLTSQAHEHLVDIGREAIRNADQHANASRILVNLEYRRRALRMSIIDDGVGIEPAEHRHCQKSSHFGLVGMRERAAQLNATFVVEKNGARGTRVAVLVPGWTAFRGTLKWMRRRTRQ